MASEAKVASKIALARPGLDSALGVRDFLLWTEVPKITVRCFADIPRLARLKLDIQRFQFVGEHGFGDQIREPSFIYEDPSFEIILMVSGSSARSNSDVSLELATLRWSSLAKA